MSRYCSRCGTRLAQAAPTRCIACGHAFFVDAKPAAGVILVDGDQFLALRRSLNPGLGRWGVPGGFCDGEHPEQAAVREAAEETQLAVDLGQLVGMYTDTYRYQGEAFPTLHIYYLATVLPDSPPLSANGDEVSETRWFPLTEPPATLAFDHLSGVVADALALVSR